MFPPRFLSLSKNTTMTAKEKKEFAELKKQLEEANRKNEAAEEAAEAKANPSKEEIAAKLQKPAEVGSTMVSSSCISGFII